MPLFKARVRLKNGERTTVHVCADDSDHAAMALEKFAKVSRGQLRQKQISTPRRMRDTRALCTRYDNSGGGAGMRPTVPAEVIWPTWNALKTAGHGRLAGSRKNRRR